MHDVVVYFSSLQKQVPSRKIDVLQAFADGAKRSGASVHIETKYTTVPAKMAVILGWPAPEQQGKNIRLRAEVVRYQRDTGNHVMAIDAGCFKFHDPDSKYLRYSLNGVFYDTSEYANRGASCSRWNLISQDLGLEMLPWRHKGEHILLLMQRDGGWSMKGLGPIEWAQQKIQEIKAQTDAPIMIRPHPGKKIDVSALASIPGVIISDSRVRSMRQDLKRARNTLVFNSSSGVASILEGVPLHVDDPSSVCWDVSQHNSRLDQIQFFDRQQWINELAAAHWSDEESRQGLVFQKFLPYIS